VRGTAEDIAARSARWFIGWPFTITVTSNAPVIFERRL
jgi:hypothetical protein